MLVVLSPSKTLDFDDCQLKLDCTQPQFLKESESLVKVLRTYSAKQIKSLMSVSDKIAELNVDRYKSFKRPFTKANSKPAIFAFKGDVYQDIEIDDYSTSELKFAQKHLRILSGLYGILRPLDLMQPYRLEMKTKLKNERGKNLYEFWGDKLTKVTKKALKEVGQNAFLVNLASQEYYSALQPDSLDVPIVTPVFKEKKGDSYKIVAIHAKRARGMMANFIVRNKITKVEQLRQFSDAKYKFRERMSSDTELVFTR